MEPQELGDDSSDSGVDDLIARFEAIKAREAAIAEQRPSAEVMGKLLVHSAKVLLATLNVRRIEGWGARGMEEGHEFEFHPMNGSLADLDLQWGESLTGFPDNPVRIALDIVQRLVAATADHLEGLGYLMAETELVRSPISLARSALEAAATAAYLIDADVSQEDRLRRSLNLRLVELGEARYEHSGDLETDEWFQVEIADLNSGVKSLGWKMSNADRGSKGLPSVAPKDSTQTVIKSVLEGDVGSSTWRSMSAVAHSREALMLLIVDALDPRGNEHARARDIATNCLPMLVVIDQLIPRLSTYLGWDLSTAWDDENKTILNAWWAGSGGFDDRIAQSLFGNGEP